MMRYEGCYTDRPEDYFPKSGKELLVYWEGKFIKDILEGKERISYVNTFPMQSLSLLKHTWKGSK